MFMAVMEGTAWWGRLFYRKVHIFKLAVYVYGCHGGNSLVREANLQKVSSWLSQREHACEGKETFGFMSTETIEAY